LAGSFALFSLIESHARHLVNHIPAALLILSDIGKPSLHPLRLLAILSLAWLAWRYLPAGARWFQSRLAEPFILMGQHSLPVFSASILFALLGESILFKNSGWIPQLFVQGFGSLALIAVGALAAWNSRDPLRNTSSIRVSEPDLARF
jgi:hypothetical protein